MNHLKFRRALNILLGFSLLQGAITSNGAVFGKSAAPEATFMVNSTADADDINRGDGTCETGPGNDICTLRAAIREANALAGADTITLPAGRDTLTLVGEDSTGAAGDLDITGDLTITGAGSGTTIIDANSAVTNDRAIDIPFAFIPRVVSISGVTIRNGKASFGGGLRNYGSLTISSSIFSSNEASSSAAEFLMGGAIYNDGWLSISDSTFSLNKALADDQNAYGGAFAKT